MPSWPDTLDKPYGEYLSLQTISDHPDEDGTFIIEGCLLIIAGIIVEHLDLAAGEQRHLERTPPDVVAQFIRRYHPTSPEQERLVHLILHGLRIVVEAIPDAYHTELLHPELDTFFSETAWAKQQFICQYYHRKAQHQP